MSVCRSCGAEIVWAVTPANRRIPLDAAPVEPGLKLKPGMYTVILAEDPDDRTAVNRAIPVAGGLIPSDGPYYQSHFATCPHADRHRRR